MDVSQNSSKFNSSNTNTEMEYYLSTKEPEYKDIVDAARNIRSYIHTTPLLRSRELNEIVEAEVLIKAELLQHTGSFKFRGAYNKIQEVAFKNPDSEIVAWSSGNHAQAVAAAAGIANIRSTIIMPIDAPKVKISGTKQYGGQIVHYDRNRENREEIGTLIANEKGATIVPPYDDPLVIAGQGTVGLEAASQIMKHDLVPDVALIPCGGGGLISGCSIALQSYFPEIRIHPVEPIGFDDTTRSLELGHRVSNVKLAESVCDALLAPTPGEITFEINYKRLSPGITVSDREVLSAMNFAFRRFKLVVEPGGAVALAALLANKKLYKNKTVLIVLSGGNVDEHVFSEALSKSY